MSVPSRTIWSTRRQVPHRGTVVTGQIVERPTVQQQTEIGTGKSLFFDDGKPREQLVVTIQTEIRDPEVDDDDGKRRVFVTGTGGFRGWWHARCVQARRYHQPESRWHPHREVHPRRCPHLPAFNPPKQVRVSYAPPNVSAGFLGGSAAAGESCLPA